MLVTRIDPHAVIGLDAHGRTDDELAKLAEARVIEPVAEPAIVLVVIDGELGGDDVARDRAGDYAADRLVKAGLDRRAEITRPFEAGRRRPQDDRAARHVAPEPQALGTTDRKSTRLNSSH